MDSGFLEAATRAKHDLGKYIAFQARWLPPGAAREEWQAGLVSDLLETRRGPSGTEDAVALWKRLKTDFAGLKNDPDVRAVDEAIERIEGRLSDLKEDRLSLADLQSLGETAKEVAQHLSALHKRLRGA